MTTEQSTVQAAKEQAKEQVHNVAATASEQTRNVMSDVVDEVQGQVGDQKAKLAGTIREIGDELDRTAQNGQGTVADLAGQAADRTRQLSTWIDTHEPRDVLYEIEDFARERPVLFVLGAATLGFLVGRVTRSAVSAAREDSPTPSSTIDLREANLPGIPMEPEGASMQPAVGIPAEPHFTGESPDVERLADSAGPLQQRAFDAESAYPKNDQPIGVGDELPEPGTSIGQGPRP